MELDRLVMACLAVEPGQRPGSAEIVLARLDALAIAEPWDQQAAKRWWASNAKRLGMAGHEVAETAARSLKQPVGGAIEGVSE
jgi:hypothetical protein